MRFLQAGASYAHSGSASRRRKSRCKRGIKRWKKKIGMDFAGPLSLAAFTAKLEIFDGCLTASAEAKCVDSFSRKSREKMKEPHWYGASA